MPGYWQGVVCFLALSTLSVQAEEILYCQQGRCLARKLTPVDANGPVASKYDCFDSVTRTSQSPTALDPTSDVFKTAQQELFSANYTMEECDGIPTGSNCNNHGTFDLTTRSCTCEGGYSGVECGNQPCPNDCHTRGYCVDGVCHCYQGFKGVGCELTKCESDCHNNGKCENGACVCYSGFTGPTCASVTCPNDCSFHGECNDGECACDAGYTGSDCSEKQCPNNCYASVGHGVCVDGVCACYATWTGHSCETAQCPNQCSGHGHCDSAAGTCKCNSGFTGNDCSQSTCAVDCGDHGICIGTQCECNPGYAGPTCLPACLGNCSSEGTCALGSDGYQCFCNKGRTGAACERTTCPNDCSGHGACDSTTDRCVCNPGYMGLDCSLATCHGGQDFAEGACSGNGYCQDNGVCQCADGWKGEKCSSQACLNSCSNHGVCTPDLVCQCSEGWTGEDCSKKTCPNACSGNGICTVEGDELQCLCEPGFSGFDCSHKLCPNDCSGHGECVKGVCYCKNQYIGEDCSTLPCGDCSGHGTCDPKTKECDCDEGYTGSICQTATCPGFPQNECNGKGVCIAGACVCNTGFSGPDCSGFCPSGEGFPANTPCSGNGKCSLAGQCMCEPGWVGPDCATKSCPQQCNGHGVCRQGVCECEAGWEGVECEDARNTGIDECGCSMQCTVQCLHHCSGIHERYGMYEGHQCYMKCNHACIVGCVTRGIPAIDHFVPDIKPDDFSHLLRAKDGGALSPDMVNPPLETVTESVLVQDSQPQIVQEDLPTMD